MLVNIRFSPNILLFYISVRWQVGLTSRGIQVASSENLLLFGVAPLVARRPLLCVEYALTQCAVASHYCPVCYQQLAVTRSPLYIRGGGLKGVVFITSALLSAWHVSPCEVYADCWGISRHTHY